MLNNRIIQRGRLMMPLLCALLWGCDKGKAAPSETNGPDGTVCKTIGGQTYCSAGRADSIVELPTGVVVCGPGTCRPDGTGYSCAPSKYAKIVENNGLITCFQNQEPVDCATPTSDSCTPP